VSARGKLLAEFGGDYAGAAVGGIAGDADFHERGSPRSSVVNPVQMRQHSIGKRLRCGIWTFLAHAYLVVRA
jgi:hypothetical protein